MYELLERGGGLIGQELLLLECIVYARGVGEELMYGNHIAGGAGVGRVVVPDGLVEVYFSFFYEFHDHECSKGFGDGGNAELVCMDDGCASGSVSQAYGFAVLDMSVDR